MKAKRRRIDRGGREHDVTISARCTHCGLAYSTVGTMAESHFYGNIP